jgi:AcrR family transcriptional regulator
MGAPGSQNWSAMLDGAVNILRDEGHAALTSRRVAEVIGVKQRLIYYYFKTMDELIVETFRRLSERELKRLNAARHAALPLRELWSVCIHTTDARLVSEFMALASRISGLTQEVVHFIEESRSIQMDAIVAAIQRSGVKMTSGPAGMALIATSVALTLTRENELGVTSGHAEALAMMEAFIHGVEPA